MKNKILLIIGLPLLLVVFAIVGLPFIVPQDSIKSYLANQVEAASGRELRIDGDLHFQLVPQVSISMEKVSLANADWGKEVNMVELGAIELRLALLPLLQSRVQIEQLTISDARIMLETTSSGQSNWEFAAYQSAATTSKPSQQLNGSSDWTVSAQNIEINRAQITIDDRQLGTRREITNFELKIPQFDFESPLQITSNFLIDGNKAQLNGEISQPKALTHGGTTDINLNLDIPGAIHAEINGNLGLTDDWAETNSDLTTNLEIPHISPDIRKLLAGLVHASGNDVLATYIMHLESLNVRTRLIISQSEHDTVAIYGQIGYQGRTINITFKLDAINSDLFQADINLRSQGIMLSYSGIVGFGTQPQVDGKYQIQITSVQKLATHLGYGDVIRVPINTVDISGNVKMIDDKLAFSSSGELAVNHGQVNLALNITSSDGIAGPINTNSKIRMPGVVAEFRGMVMLDLPPRVDGRVTMQINSLTESLAWWDIDFPPLVSAEQISLDTKLQFANDNAELTELKVIQGDQTLTGNLHLRGIDTQHRLEGQLTVANLNLEKLLGPEKASPATKARASKQGWDKTPIDLKPLRMYGADLTLSMTQANLYGLKIDRATARLQADDGDVSLVTSTLNLYDGTGSINAKLDAQAEPFTVAADIRLSSLNMRQMLTDLAGLSKLEGTFNMNSTIQMHGVNEDELIRSLTGSGQFTAQDGIIHGINIPDRLSNILSALSVKKSRAEQNTKYAQMEGSWKITQGILENKDFLLTSSILEIPGAGTVDIPARTLDYRVQAQLTSLSPNQSTLLKNNKFAIPVRITGPWDDPSIRPDLAAIQPELLRLLGGKFGLGEALLGKKRGIIEDTTKTLREAPKKLGKELKSVLDGLLPGLDKSPKTNRKKDITKKDNEKENEEEKEDKKKKFDPKELLKGLLGN